MAGRGAEGGAGQSYEELARRADFAAVMSGFLNTNLRSKRFLSLAISHEHPHEAALYLVRPGDLTITHVIPVLADLHIQAQGLTEPSLAEHDVNTTLQMEGLAVGTDGKQSSNVILHVSAKHLPVFLERYHEMSSTAVKKRFLRSSGSHKWLIMPAGSAGIQLAPKGPVPSPDAAASTDTAEQTPIPPPRGVVRDSGTNASSDFFQEHVAQKAFEYNPHTMTELKGQWLSEQLQARAPEFTNHRAVTVCIGSYNVNGRLPKGSNGEVLNLRPWTNVGDASPDIYAFGFQELDLSAEAFVFKDSSREGDWVRAIEDSFPEDHSYKKLKSKQLVGMLVVVYVKGALLPFISNIQTDAQGTGIMGVMGNKGGVAVRFQLYDSTFCFVNSHLAAHDDAVARRNQDFAEISRRLNLGGLTTADHDATFWFGDLNYRVDGSYSDITRLARAMQLDPLLANDQLLAQRQAGNVFQGFVEGDITFPPTYKYDPGTDTFDTSEKQRAPAYCDRVMYREAAKFTESMIRQTEYTSAHALRLSDHKPVRAQYAVQAAVIDLDKYKEVYQSIIRASDTIENQSIPDATVSSNQLVFENLQYLEPQTKSLGIENTGQVLAQYDFRPKPDEKVAHPPWLKIRPMHGVLVPGEKRSILFTADVSSSVAAKCNASGAPLEDILILHLKNGRGFFISVSAQFLRTSFCCSLEALVSSPASIRELPAGPLEVASSESRLKVPKELWRLVDYLFKNGMDEPSLFLNSGSEHHCRKIRECLDTGAEFPEGLSVHSYAETLIHFLDALAEPLIPFALYSRCIDCSHSYILCRQILGDLSHMHQTCFIYVVKFLHQLIRHKSSNGLSADKLALLFGLVILRQAPLGDRGPSRAHLQQSKRAAFLQHFLLIDDL